MTSVVAETSVERVVGMEPYTADWSHPKQAEQRSFEGSPEHRLLAWAWPGSAGGSPLSASSAYGSSPAAQCTESAEVSAGTVGSEVHSAGTGYDARRDHSCRTGSPSNASWEDTAGSPSSGLLGIAEATSLFAVADS